MIMLTIIMIAAIVSITETIIGSIKIETIDFSSCRMFVRFVIMIVAAAAAIVVVILIMLFASSRRCAFRLTRYSRYETIFKEWELVKVLIIVFQWMWILILIMLIHHRHGW